ncbi:WD40-repeat-containing domain protein [Chytridium lagenaria]|nr:WD40-repeat-containing domain protein [Chytridium lagenaria]
MEIEFMFPKSSDSIVAVAFNFDGMFVACGSLDGGVRVANLEIGEVVLSLDGPMEVTWLRWHPRGNALLCGSSDGIVWMWQIPSGKCLNVFSGHSNSVGLGAFSYDGKSIITGGDDGNLIVWDPKAATVKTRLSISNSRFHTTGITAMGLSHTSNIVMTGAEDGSLILSNLDTSKVISALPSATASIECIEFSKRSHIAASASVDGTVLLWDLGSMQERCVFTEKEAVTKLKILDGSAAVVTSSMDGDMRIWDMRTHECVMTLGGGYSGILDFVAKSDEMGIVAGGDDGSCMYFAL